MAAFGNDRPLTSIVLRPAVDPDPSHHRERRVAQIEDGIYNLCNSPPHRKKLLSIACPPCNKSHDE
jgi:hypothetical protein